MSDFEKGLMIIAIGYAMAILALVVVVAVIAIDHWVESLRSRRPARRPRPDFRPSEPPGNRVLSQGGQPIGSFPSFEDNLYTSDTYRVRRGPFTVIDGGADNSNEERPR